MEKFSLRRRKQRRKRQERGIGMFVAFCLTGIIICLVCKSVFMTSSSKDSDSYLREHTGVTKTSGMMKNDKGEEEKAEEKKTDDEPLCIVLDAGHGGYDPGTVNDDIYEKDINLDIVLKLEKKLKQCGYRVILTRRDDDEVSLAERTDLSNTSDADLFISIHQNSLEDDEITSGIETWYLPKDNYSGILAGCLQNALIDATEAKDRGIHSEQDLHVNRETDAVSCLIETGFLSSADEVKLLTDDEYQDKIADGIVCGIGEFLRHWKN